MKNFKLLPFILAVLFSSAQAFAAYNPNNANGQATMANSAPATIASDQSPIVHKVYACDTITRAGNNATAYASGQAISANAAGAAVTTQCQLTRSNDVLGNTYNISLTVNGTSVTTHGAFRIHFYNSQPTLANGDNGVWLTAITGYAGCYDVTLSQSFSSNTAYGRGIPCAGSQMLVTPISGSTKVYYIIEARDAYVPSALETFTPSVEIE